MLRTRKSKSDGPLASAIERLEARASDWEKLAANARQREDDGEQNTLRECRPYPAGYWTGMAAGLENAAREVRAIVADLKASSVQ